MSKTNITQEERQMIKLIEKFHLPEETKSGWTTRIRSGEMSEDLAEEIRQALSGQGEGEGGAASAGGAANAGGDAGAAGETDQPNRARHLVELSMLVKRWRLSSQSHNFGRK